MSQPDASRQAPVHIQGEISGQVAVGDYNLQIGQITGGRVTVNLAALPRAKPRPTPIRLAPRPFAALLDRQAEIKATAAALQQAATIEFWGEDGLGKTTLLQYIASAVTSKTLPDGVVYLEGQRRPVDDVLLFLWDAFYEREPGYLPTDAQLRHDLYSKRALILLDDVDLERVDLQTLLNATPQCAFCLAARQRHISDAGAAHALSGLPTPDALTLIERELGRSLTPQEKPAAHALCTTLHGNPWYVLRAADLVHERRYTFNDLVSKIRTPNQAGRLTTWTVNALTAPEQRIVAVLLALEGAPVHVDDLTAITGSADTAAALQSLQQRAVIQAHSPRYTLSGPLGDQLQSIWDVTPWAERALAHFTGQAEAHRRDSRYFRNARDPIIHLLDWAARTQRWKDVIRLGRSAEESFTLSGLWGAWAHVLQTILRAAQALNDPATEAWALHQLGSRALCLGAAAEANALLKNALQIRLSLGDQIGAAATQHNLGLLAGPLPPPRQPPVKPAPPTGLPPIAMALIITCIIAVSVLWLSQAFKPLPVIISPKLSPTPTLTPRPMTLTQPPSITPSHTLRPPTFTFTPTGTRPPTHTPTPTGSPGATPTDTPSRTATDTPTVTPSPTLFDTTPPAIGRVSLTAYTTSSSATPSPSDTCPDMLRVTVEAQAVNGIRTIELWYRTPPQTGPWKHEALTESSYSIYSLDWPVLIPPNSSSPVIYEFYIYAEDAYGSHTKSSIYQYVVSKVIQPDMGKALTQVCRAFFVMPNMTYSGNNYQTTYPPANDPNYCWQYCGSDDQCTAYTYLQIGTMPPSCWLKKSPPALVPDPNGISGIRIWPVLLY